MTPELAGAPAALPRARLRLAFGGLVLVMMLGALDATIVATALPTIVGELGGLDRLGWVVTAYLVAQTVVGPVYGKLGDLHGRKPVLVAGVLLFLAGSALCGMSRSMEQLIAFRALQGLGGGGLIVTTQAIVGDLVSPRERGRYQGIFGGVFGVASILGPLVGGTLTTQLSWRWIFYVNLPLGALALAVVAAVLPRLAGLGRRALDWRGAALLALTLAAVTLLADLGGTAFAWTSPAAAGLAAATVAGGVLFVLVERRAEEPILPLRLLADRTFAVAALVGFAAGFALFGSVTYLPTYLQVVQGATPTGSGLLMVPQMAGMMVTSIVSGQLISRTGRYRWSPILGAAAMSVALVLLARLTPATPRAAVLGLVALLGLGMGLVMQVLVLAVQNAVPYRDLGVATSGATLFRLVGGSLGTAALGAVFARRLAAGLASALPGADARGLGPAELAALPPAARAASAEAFTAAVTAAFAVAAAVAIAGFALAWLLPARRLREAVGATAADLGHEAGRTFTLGTPDDAAEEIARALAAVAGRDVRRRWVASVVARAGLALRPSSAWLLIQLDRDHLRDPRAVARRYRIPEDELGRAQRELVERGLVEAEALAQQPARLEVTPAGCDALRRLVAARRARLDELVADWGPQGREDLARLLRRLARELVPDVRIEPGPAPARP